MKVVTFNLRCDNNGDGENRWQFRKGIILDKIETEQPDLIGFQEVTVVMSDFLKRHMTDYLCVGNGRNADYGGENNMIALRKDKFELMFLETFWLSPTPDIAGSRYENQSSCPRICTHVILRILGSTQLFHFYNTHLDHQSDEARVLGATALMKRMNEDQKKHPLPLLLTGDMNARPDSEPILIFAENTALPLVEQTKGIPFSFHGFDRPDYVCPQIDYIFSKGFKTVQPLDIWNEKPYGKNLSDHYALCAHVNID